MCWPMRPTHARHLDPFWSLLRSVCLAVYWFDPLVWSAAAGSKADGELACDEAVHARPWEQGERIPYGTNAAGPDPGADGSRLSPALRHHHDRR